MTQTGAKISEQTMKKRRSSGENGSNVDIDMGNLICSISADKKVQDEVDLWYNKYNKQEGKHWKDDVKKMSECSQGGD